MIKRNLSKQQLRNIKKYKLSDKYSITMQGLVITNFGSLIEVEKINRETFFCHYRQNLGTIVAGDQVFFSLQKDSKYGIICGIIPRSNFLVRPNKSSKYDKIIAANIDQIVIVLAVNPAPVEHYIDRYLVVAHYMKIKVIIVFNKIDLFKNAKNKEQLKEIIDLYRKLKYKVIISSALQHTNLQELKASLKNKTSIIVGQSGVGKSEIINSLFGRKVTLTGQISISNRKGRHTTTNAKLFHLNVNTNIIDSPGIRKFGIWHLNKIDIFKGYQEFTQLKYDCKFRNCKHLDGTNGCIIHEAVDNGVISKQRFINYHRLISEHLEENLHVFK